MIHGSRNQIGKALSALGAVFRPWMNEVRRSFEEINLTLDLINGMLSSIKYTCCTTIMTDLSDEKGEKSITEAETSINSL